MFRSRRALACSSSLLVVAIVAAILGACLATRDAPPDETSLAVETPIATAQPSGTPSLHPAVPPVPASSNDAPKPDATALGAAYPDHPALRWQHAGTDLRRRDERLYFRVCSARGLTVCVLPASFLRSSPLTLTRKLVHDSGLGFDLTYVPAGYELEDLLDGGHNTGPVSPGCCDGTVISLIETWYSRYWRPFHRQ